MNPTTAVSARQRLYGWVQLQAAYCLPGALMALALTLPMYRRLLLWHHGSEEIYYELRDVFAYLSDIPTLIAMGAWLLTPYPRRIRELPRWLLATLACLAVLGTLSALWAPMPLTTLYHSARLWVLLVLYLIIATTPEARGALLWGIALSGALQAGIGIAQFVNQATFGLTDLGEVLVRPEWSGASVITVGGWRILRAYGLTQHPNVLGGFLAVATLVGAGLVLSQRGRRSVLAIALTGLNFAGLLFSFSRSAWVGLAVGGLVGAILLRRTPGLAPVPQQAATSAPNARTPGLAPVPQQAATSAPDEWTPGLAPVPQQAATSAPDEWTPGLAPVPQQAATSTPDEWTPGLAPVPQQAATSAPDEWTPGLAPVPQQAATSAPDEWTPGLAPVPQQAATSTPDEWTPGLAPVPQQAATSGVARRLVTLVGVLFAIGLLFAATQWPLLRPRLGFTVEGVEIRSVDERAVLEAAAWTLIREEPWLGVGYASFAIALLERQPAALAAYPIYQPVHRVPLLAAAELGVPGVALWAIMAAGPWAAIWARRRTWPPPAATGILAISAAAALATLTVISWFDFYPWYGQPGRLLTWTMLALWAQSFAGWSTRHLQNDVALAVTQRERTTQPTPDAP